MISIDVKRIPTLTPRWSHNPWHQIFDSRPPSCLTPAVCIMFYWIVSIAMNWKWFGGFAVYFNVCNIPRWAKSIILWHCIPMWKVFHYSALNCIVFRGEYINSVSNNTFSRFHGCLICVFHKLHNAGRRWSDPVAPEKTPRPSHIGFDINCKTSHLHRFCADHQKKQKSPAGCPSQARVPGTHQPAAIETSFICQSVLKCFLILTSDRKLLRGGVIILVVVTCIP